MYHRAKIPFPHQLSFTLRTNPQPLLGVPKTESIVGGAWAGLGALLQPPLASHVTEAQVTETHFLSSAMNGSCPQAMGSLCRFNILVHGKRLDQHLTVTAP